MRLTIRALDTVQVVKVEGELKRSTARNFLRQARRLLGFAEAPLVALNLHDVPRLDASGGAALVALLRHVQSRQGELCLFGLEPGPRRLLEIMQLHLVLDVAPDLPGAVETLAVPTGSAEMTVPRSSWVPAPVGVEAVTGQAAS